MPSEFKTLTDQQMAAIEREVKNMLHASRDCYRNQFRRFLGGVNTNPAKDPKTFRFNVADGYYGEAFGILRGLRVLGYGHMDGRMTDNDHDLKAWMYALEKEVLQEENYGGSGECDHCLKKWGKDDAGRTRE